MKYMVMVNNKYMTQVDIEGSACAAEHLILDDLRYGMVSALAFDSKAMGTDYFNCCFQRCEYIPFEELKRKSDAAKADYDTRLADAAQAINDISAQIKALETKRENMRLELNAMKGNTGEI